MPFALLGARGAENEVNGNRGGDQDNNGRQTISAGQLAGIAQKLQKGVLT